MADSSRNVTMNGSLSLNETGLECVTFAAADSTRDQVLMTTGYAILLTLSLLGNIFVIAVFYKRYDQLRTPVNCFIVNMAASDLLVPLFVLPRRIQEIFLGWRPWLVGGVLGDILCRLLNFADEISITVSSQSMVFVAAERFWAIVFSLKQPLISQRTTPRFICFTWIFSIIFFSYYFFAHKLAYEDKTLYCQYGLPQIFDSWEDLWRADRITFLIVFVAIPFILLTVFYTAIIVTLRRQERNAIHLSAEVQRVRSKENQSVALMLVAIVVLFFISWTPHYIYFFLQYYSLGPKLSCDSMKRLYLSSMYINYSYTAINPLIYYTFNPTYRRGFHELLGYPWFHLGRCGEITVHQQPNQPIELVEPVERVEPNEQVETVELVEPNEQVEPVELIDSVELVQ